MARGIGHRQKKVVAAKKVWIKAGQPAKSFPLPPRQRDWTGDKRKSDRKSKAGEPDTSSS